MFITRLLSGIVLLALSLFFVIEGGIWLNAFTFVLSILAFYEMMKALGHEKKSGFLWCGFIGTIAYYAVLCLAEESSRLMLVMIACFTIIVFLTVYVIRFPKYNVSDTMSAVFSFVYAPVMLSFLPLTRALPEGKYIVWMIYISAWGYDTCAYCVGTLTAKTIGNHKAFPKLSPKKSIEGIVGGIIGAAVLGWLYGHFVAEPYSGLESVSWILAGISAIGAVIAQVGDLAASAVKRDTNIKDYGKIIPGHGGILDRFDSMIFTAPIIFFLAEIFLFAVKG